VTEALPAAIFDPAYIKNRMIKAAGWQLANPNGKPENTWTNATLYAGIMEAYKATGNTLLLDSLMAMGKRNKWQPARRYDHADDIAIGQVYIDLYRLTRDQSM